MDAGSYLQVSTSEFCAVSGELKQKRKKGDWNQRHCATWKNYFLCFKDENGIKPQVAFVLEGFEVDKCREESENFAFRLSKPGVVAHTFATTDEKLLNTWIQNLIAAGANNPPPLVTIEDDDSVFEPTLADHAVDKPHFPFLETDALNLSKPEPLHTCLSFDSATAVLRADQLDSKVAPSLHRSQEMEDLLNLDQSLPLPEESIESEDDGGLTFSAKSLRDSNGSAGEETGEKFANLEDDVNSTTNLLAAISNLNAFIKKETEEKPQDVPSTDQKPNEVKDMKVDSKTKPSTSRDSELIPDSATEELPVQGNNESGLSPGDEIENQFSGIDVAIPRTSTATPSSQTLITAMSATIS